MAHDRPPSIDPIAAERWAQHGMSASPWLHEEVARRMDERLACIRAKPKAWAHFGAVNGGLEGHALVAARYPEATTFVVEVSPARQAVARQALTPAWWRPQRWRRSAELQFEHPPNGAVDLLWSNMGLHMAADPQAWIEQWYKALSVDGFLMFSCLGPDTLRELRPIYQQLGWPVPAHVFTDMHDWGDMLVNAGFAEPVMDMERITLTYETPQRLLADLRELGRNLHPARFAGLRTPRWQHNLEAQLRQHLRQLPASDRVTKEVMSLTFEVVYGHAFKPAPRMQLAEHSAVSLEEMRTMLRAGRNPN